MQHNELLKYEDATFCQEVLHPETNQPIGFLENGDILIIVKDIGGPFLHIMMPNGRVGWTKYVPWRMLKLEHAGPVVV